MSDNKHIVALAVTGKQLTVDVAELRRSVAMIDRRVQTVEREIVRIENAQSHRVRDAEDTARHDIEELRRALLAAEAEKKRATDTMNTVREWCFLIAKIFFGAVGIILALWQIWKGLQ